MMKVIFNEDGSPTLRNEEILSLCETWKERVNPRLDAFSQRLKGMGYPTTEKYLRGCLSGGSDFVKKETEREFREAVKKFPLALGSIDRLVKEKLAEIPGEVFSLVEGIRNDMKVPSLNGVRAFTLQEGDIVYNSGRLQISDSFSQRMEDAHTRELSEKELELEKDLSLLVETIRKWDEMGVNMMPEQLPDLRGGFFLNPGILGSLVGSRFSDQRPELSREALLLAIVNNQGETKSARKARLGK